MPRPKAPGPVGGVVLGLVLGLVIGLLALPRTSGTVTVTAGRRGGRSSRGTGAPGDESGTAADASGNANAAAGGSGPAAGAGASAGSGIYGNAGAANGAGGAGGGAGAGPSGPVRGVSATSVTIGVAVLDLGAVTVLGPEYDNKDVEGQWNAVLADWHDRHLLPVNGRDVVFKYERYNVLNYDDQRRACAALVDDDKSFAVVGIEFFYQEGADCVAREKRTPLLTSEGPDDGVFARSAPYLFSLQMSQSRLLRNFVHWADARGALKGKKLGIYYYNDPNVARLMHDTVRAEMMKLGYPPPVEMTTSDRQGGPEDALAVRKFETSGVNVVALFTSPGGFMQQADAQRYKPAYIQTDYEGGTSDVGTNTYPVDQYDGTPAMTTLRRGEPAAGIPPTPEEERCVSNYERRSGHHVARPGQSGHEAAEWVFIVLSCDEGNVLLQALRSAGRDLTTASFVNGLEAVKNLPLIRYPNVTFGPDDYQGVEQQRTLYWHGDCTCWRATGSFGPLWTP